MASLFPLSLRGQGPNAVLKELGPEGIERLAHWERQIRNRSKVRSNINCDRDLLFIGTQFNNLYTATGRNRDAR
jgi:hypothetical protein